MVNTSPSQGDIHGFKPHTDHHFEQFTPLVGVFIYFRGIMTDRIKTKKIMVGNVQIGGNNKVVIQLLLIQR